MMMIWVHSFFYDLMDSNDWRMWNKSRWKYHRCCLFRSIKQWQRNNEKNAVISKLETGFSTANNNSNYDAFFHHHACHDIAFSLSLSHFGTRCSDDKILIYLCLRGKWELMGSIEIKTWSSNCLFVCLLKIKFSLEI